MEPIVSIVMPCYNMAEYVGLAIQSIINQSFRTWELVIVDDCSDDGSFELIEKLANDESRIKYYKNDKNRGVFFSRNYGIEKSCGRYIALMDADDIAYPDRLEMQIEYLENHPDVSAVSGYYDYLDMNGKSTINKDEMKFLNSDDVKVRLVFEFLIAEGSTIFRRNILKNNGIRFPEEYPAVGGYKFWCDFVQVGKINILPLKFYQYRINENGLTQVTKRKDQQLRYKWHDTIHQEYWEKCNLTLENTYSLPILKFTRGQQLDNLGEVIKTVKGINIIQAQLIERKFASSESIKSVCAYEKKRIYKQYFWNSVSKLYKVIMKKND